MVTFRHKKSGRLYNYARFTYHFLSSVPRIFGKERLNCPVCENQSRFLAFGQPPRFNALCPRCGALERHRLLKLWIDAHGDLVDGKRVLHFAPEAIVARLLRERSAEYVGADIDPGNADVVLNIEDIALDSETYDLVVCLHVLEHVDDKAALSEVYRILSPGGAAVFMFPIVEGWPTTLEEEDIPVPIRSTADRIKYFGQYDHVRYFGRDVRERIRAAGFDLEEYVATEPDVSTHGLMRGETAFVARKPVQ